MSADSVNSPKFCRKRRKPSHANVSTTACPDTEFSGLCITSNRNTISPLNRYLTQLAGNGLELALGTVAKKLLISLRNHWGGLTVFVDRPEIPMDNNPAERALRPGVLGRKNYSGSGAVWSSELTAVMYSLLETLKIWKLNEHAWLLNYFYECALIGGKPPANIEKYLPWNMTEDQRILLSDPAPHQNLQ